MAKRKKTKKKKITCTLNIGLGGATLSGCIIAAEPSAKKRRRK